jgi:hypothetical protein
MKKIRYSVPTSLLNLKATFQCIDNRTPKKAPSIRLYRDLFRRSSHVVPRERSSPASQWAPHGFPRSSSQIIHGSFYSLLPRENSRFPDPFPLFDSLLHTKRANFRWSFLCGAARENRTLTPLLETDFESVASTNSATAAGGYKVTLPD